MRYLAKYIWLFILFLWSCHELEDPLIIIDPADVIRLSVVNESLQSDTTLLEVKADSLSSRLVLATLETRGDPARSIVFMTTAGALTQAGQLPSKN